MSGCATIAFKDESPVYSSAMIDGAPKLIIVDLLDRRYDKNKFGQICLLNCSSSKPIASILTDRIAVKLKEAGFNLQKVSIPIAADKDAIKKALRSNNGKALFTGELYNFFVASFDAMLEPAKGEASFYIEIYDQNAGALFNKKYAANSQNWIGLTGESGAKKTAELCIQAAVGAMFNDPDFTNILEQLKKRQFNNVERPQVDANNDTATVQLQSDHGNSYDNL